MQAQAKPLPPPPGGYYAPVSKSVDEPSSNYGNQAYPQYENTYARGYQPALVQADYISGNGYYGHHSSPPSQSPPFQSQSQLRQPQSQAVEYVQGHNNYTHHSSPLPQHQPQLQQAQSQHQLSISSRSYNNISPTLNSSNSGASNTSPGLEQSRSRARDLRMRSRSPRPSQMRAIGSRSENVNYADPAYNLGKFHAVTETPRIGDQSLPFPITLPDDLANGQLSPRSSIQPESSIFYNRNRSPADRIAGLGLNQESGMSIGSAMTGAGHTSTRGHDTNRAMNSEIYETRPVIAKNKIPVELPVPNDHDEEEIVMSSTAYPGQEWQPAGFEQWMPY